MIFPSDGLDGATTATWRSFRATVVRKTLELSSSDGTSNINRKTASVAPFVERPRSWFLSKPYGNPIT